MSQTNQSEIERVAKYVVKLTSEEAEINTPSLGTLYRQCDELYTLLESCDLPFSSSEFQVFLRVCIRGLEQCTIMVNQLELFSTNETAKELLTSSIKFLLLPALLGSLTLMSQSKDASGRSKIIERAEVYFKDFLLRCINYEIGDMSTRELDELFSEDTNNEDTSLEKMANCRQVKIQQYQRKKELEEKLKLLKPALERPEEDNIREYFFCLIEKYIITAKEELQNIKREKQVLKFMPKKEDRAKIPQVKQVTKPLKPFIITKNEIEKQVFGLGYPSLPVMTIDDFYRQRFEKQIEEQKQEKIKQQSRSLQDAALKREQLRPESEEIEKEELLEKDDPEAILRARQWDDWKDDNPRGSGNRYNKG